MTIDSLNLLIVEIIACLALAALLGLVVGWFIRQSIAKRAAAKAKATANQRYKALEESSRQDANNLEEQLQSLGNELKSERSNNRNLSTSLKSTESSIDKARSESIELNRVQIDTNERLQAIVREKDIEINRLMNATPSSGNKNLAAAAASVGASAALINQISKPTSADADGNETLDTTKLLSNRPQRDVSPDDASGKDTNDTVAALNASANQLQDERQALLDALTEGEETIAIDYRDLPIELRQSTENLDSDATIAMDRMDKTIKAYPDDFDDTEMSDTLETP